MQVQDSLSRASRGELYCDAGISAAERERLRELWMHRVGSYNRHDLAPYLRDFSHRMTCIINGRVVAAGMGQFRRRMRLLFWLLRLGDWVGLRTHAEVLDLRVEKRAGDFVASFVFVQIVGPVLVYLAQCTQTMSHRDGRLQFAVFDMRVPARGRWPLEYSRNAATGRRELRSGSPGMDEVT